MSLTKEEIILKTVNIWNENNFQDISLSPVAKALGISKPALYKHFRDKEELIVEIYEYFTAEYGIQSRPANGERPYDFEIVTGLPQ